MAPGNYIPNFWVDDVRNFPRWDMDSFLEANQFSNCFQIDAIVPPWRLDLAVVGTTAILRLLHQAGSHVICELVWCHLGQDDEVTTNGGWVKKALVPVSELYIIICTYIPWLTASNNIPKIFGHLKIAKDIQRRWLVWLIISLLC